ncbi:MAG: glycosyltransferase [Paludibacteraceae bacterium]|nr:glycosyltransferase [Paludibacteraceae bacterium]
MKILLVIDTYDTNNNGTSISAQRFAAVLREHGNEVRILTTGEPAPDKFVLKEFKVPLFNDLIHSHGFQFAQVDLDIIREAVAWADIVHCMMPFALETATKLIADQIHKPSTAAFHIQPENMTSSIGLGKAEWLNNRFYYTFRFLLYQHFNHIHVPSQFMADELVKRGYKAKIHVISNGIDPDFIAAGQRKLSNSDGGHTSRSDGSLITIVMVGRLSGEKRQDVIINAVPFSKYADRIQLVFAGKGPKYDEYVELGKQLKNPPQFVFLSKPELIDLLLRTDLYVHASDMESEAISCIEAFATGLVPVIANSEDSATPQFALDGRSLFAPGRPKDLARAIDWWFDHPDEKAKMEREYAEAAKNYDIDTSVRLCEQMFREAIEETENQEENHA